MKHSISLSLSPEELFNQKKLYSTVARYLKIDILKINHIQIVRQSLDARRKIAYQVNADVYTDETIYRKETFESDYKNVSSKPPVIIVGTGPAGLFAALRALEVGLKPILIEQGKNVKDRKLDIADITRNKIVNPTSNWCFGEGGAGTYSDGKLYTRSNKRGNIRDILSKFVEHGANENILLEAHAHIGTDKLSPVIANIRNTIKSCGGEYYFETKVADFIVQNNSVKGVLDSKGNKYEGIAVVLATGHSARDIYELFRQKGWQIESKPFALGIRVEHPQELINQIQYHSTNYSKYLPPASYSLTAQVNKRGVFSFCMCPGGIIVPAATAGNEQVVNGMSNSMRNSPFANAGIAVSVSPEDIQSTEPLALLQFQKEIEQKMFIAGGSNLSAPTQRMTDFCSNKPSPALNPSSYLGECTSAPLHELLPQIIVKPLQEAFHIFGKKMKGFYTDSANIHAIESRTSSPVRIPRNEQYEHIQLKNLYPCGEGAGYAGGIVSSAMDGINCINQIAIENQIAL